MRTKNKATLKTIADELNISISTASRAFSRAGSVKPATLERIREVSKRLNYKPNLTARALVQQKSHVIGFILQSVKNQTTESLIKRLTNLLDSNGYDIHLTVAHDSDEINNNAVNNAICRGYDGVIIHHSAFEGRVEAIETLISEHIPFVVYGQYDYSPVDQVIGDFKLAGRVMTRHLVDLGHKDIAFVTTHHADPRYEGHCSILRQSGIDIKEQLYFQTECEQQGVKLAVEKLIKTEATAVFGNSDQMASRLIRALKDFGVKVPQEMSVVGVGNEMYADLVSPALTTFELNNAHLADNLFEALFERINNPTSPTRTILLNGNIVVRESSQPIN